MQLTNAELTDIAFALEAAASDKLKAARSRRHSGDEAKAYRAACRVNAKSEQELATRIRGYINRTYNAAEPRHQRNGLEDGGMRHEIAPQYALTWGVADETLVAVGARYAPPPPEHGPDCGGCRDGH